MGAGGGLWGGGRLRKGVGGGGGMQKRGQKTERGEEEACVCWTIAATLTPAWLPAFSLSPWPTPVDRPEDGLLTLHCHDVICQSSGPV